MLPALSRYGNPVGVDIAKGCVELTRKRGFDCFYDDIFSFAPSYQFDTITLFGSGPGMAGRADNLAMFLRVLTTLLVADGKILAVTRNFDAQPFLEMNFTPHWNKKVGKKFDWLIFSHEFLANTCNQLNFNLKTLFHSWKYRLVEIHK